MITLQITAVTMSPVCPDLSLLCPPLLGGPPSSSLQNAATLKSVAQPSQTFSSAGRAPVTTPSASAVPKTFLKLEGIKCTSKAFHH